MSKSSGTPKGTVARRSQDRTHASTTIVEYVPAPPSKAKRNITTCIRCNKPMSSRFVTPGGLCSECIDKDIKAQRAEEEKARKAAEAEIASRIHRTCRDCGKDFYIKAIKAEELKAAGMELFSCCYACQQIRKAKREADKK